MTSVAGLLKAFLHHRQRLFILPQPRLIRGHSFPLMAFETTSFGNVSTILFLQPFL